MGQARGYVHRVDIHAEIDDVWQALIDPAILARWHVPNARVDARRGGSYWTRLDANVVREAHIDVFQPPRRLRLIYMPLAGLPDDGAVLVDDFLLDRDPAAGDVTGPVTIVRLMGSGVPEDPAWDGVYIRLRNGWERALLRLKVSFERKDESVVKRPAASADARRARPEDKLLEWPEPARKPTSGENPLLGPSPEPPRYDNPFRKADDSDFIKWPEPTPTKKR